MKIIMLSGKASCGKNSTLNMVYNSDKEKIIKIISL